MQDIKSVYKISDDRCLDIMTFVACSAVWEEGDIPLGDIKLMTDIRNKFSGDEREFALYLTGKLSAIHDERGNNPIYTNSFKDMGIIQQAFDVKDELDTETFEVLYKAMRKRIDKAWKSRDRRDEQEPNTGIDIPNLPLNGN